LHFCSVLDSFHVLLAMSTPHLHPPTATGAASPLSASNNPPTKDHQSNHTSILFTSLSNDVNGVGTSLLGIGSVRALDRDQSRLTEFNFRSGVATKQKSFFARMIGEGNGSGRQTPEEEEHVNTGVSVDPLNDSRSPSPDPSQSPQSGRNSPSSSPPFSPHNDLQSPPAPMALTPSVTGANVSKQYCKKKKKYAFIPRTLR
jgi:hypothetical protein